MSEGSERRHNVPAVPSSFIGRAGEVATLVELLNASRVVTVTGPAGMGKTRLATEVARHVADCYPDGVWMVELASLHDPEQLLAAAGSVVPFADEGDQVSLDALAVALGERCVLLVLDNCEQLVHACAQLADELVRRCPHVSILTTSQEPLAVPGEQLWHVRSLALPAPEADDDPDALADTAAVRLFVDRAWAQRADFALTREVAPAVAEICRRLDGNPLAIELAAARLPMLGAAELVRRLEDRFRVLTGGARTALPRHQTLQGALDWSHALLTEPEQVLFRRLSVFDGGWTFEAAAEVCSDDTLHEQRIFDLLSALVAKSLVATDPSCPPRHRLLETTRSYAQARLADAGETADAEARHASWFAALAEEAEPELADGEQRTWLRLLDRERDDLLAALSWAADNGQQAVLLRLASALVLYWSMRGRFREGLEWLDHAAATTDGPPERRATALWGAGLLAYLLGQHDRATAHGQDSLALARELEDERVQARALTLLGAVGVTTRAGPTASMDSLEKGLALARRVGDSWCEVASLVPLGFGHLLAGELEPARQRFEGCLDLAERIDSEAGEGHRLHALLGLGRAEVVAGDHRAAEDRLWPAARLADEAGIISARLTALRALSEAARLRGDYAAADRLLKECLDAEASMGSTPWSTTSRVLLARLALAQGEISEAGRLLDEADLLETGPGLGVPGPRAFVDAAAVSRVAGDLPAARAWLEQALTAARRAEDLGAEARALRELGALARTGEDYPRAASLHHEALEQYRRAGEQPGVVACLEAFGGLEARQGRARDGARLLSAAQALRDAAELARAPINQPQFEADVACAREALGPEFDEAWSEGGSLSTQEAVSLAGRRRGPRRRPNHGWASLTRREREVTQLVARGLTNPQIAARLFVSNRTVQSHLSRIYTKLGLPGREVLAAEVAQRGRTLG